MVYIFTQFLLSPFKILLNDATEGYNVFIDLIHFDFFQIILHYII